MINIASKFWRWLFMRSPHNAANPNPGATPISAGYSGAMPGTVEPIELAIEEDAVLGSALSVQNQTIAVHGPSGELIRTKKNHGLFCNCGHLVATLFQPGKDNNARYGMACKCYVCQAENELLVLAGLISSYEAELRSLVCNKCIRVTVSGRLCCPRHSMAVPDANGTTVYLGPEEQQELKKKQVMQAILQPIIGLFCDQAPQSSSQKAISHE